jgi:ABC-type antimicrobial peptide transport system permease subunit
MTTEVAVREETTDLRCGQHHQGHDGCILDREPGRGLNRAMGSVWLSLRADLRLRWRPLAALALLLGLIGGVVLAAAAGARRTDTAYPRLLQWASAAQVDILPEGNASPLAYFAAVARLPQVAALSVGSAYQMVIPVRHGLPQTVVMTYASPNASMGVTTDRFKILQGRMFGPRSAGQAVIDPELASLEHLRAGGMLHLLAVPSNPKTGSPEIRHAVPVAFRVSAVGVFDSQVVPATAANSEPTVLLSPSFTGTPAAARSGYGTVGAVRLRPGASMTGFLAAADALAKRYPAATAGAVAAISLADEVAATQQAIRPDAVALAAFAALAGLIALAVIGQLLGRQLVLDATEFPILRALGMTRARLVALSLARVAVVTLAGAVVAVAVAIAASPLMPIGPARLAEPQPGVEVDLAILGAGFAAIALLPLLVLVPAAWRAAARVQGPLGVAEPAVPARASRLGPALARVGSVTASVGVRMAFEPGRGRTAVPVRSALAGTTVAIAAVVAAVVFGTSLIALVGTPHRYGQNWAQELDLNFAGVTAAAGARLVSAEPAVTGYAAGNYGQLTVDGKIVAAIGISPVHGRGYFTLLAGHYPSGPGEIALGAQTLRAIHRQLGQTVRVVVNPTDTGGITVRRVMRIVGVAVFAGFSRGSFAATDLGVGAAVAAALLSAPFPGTGCVNITCYNFFLLRYRPGTNLNATTARLTAAMAALGCPPGPDSCSVTADQRPTDIRNYAGVRDTPLALGGVLALLAVATLAHVLLTGVRRRRRDLAVLKTLGLRRSQVIRVVSWQASALAAAALLVGLPLGVLAGRWAWALFAGSAGVSAQADVPVPLVLLAIPVTVLLANLIAAGPGWTAARIRPALTLRSE